jgi:hypothetical protein
MNDEPKVEVETIPPEVNAVRLRQLRYVEEHNKRLTYDLKCAHHELDGAQRTIEMLCDQRDRVITMAARRDGRTRDEWVRRHLLELTSVFIAESST